VLWAVLAAAAAPLQVARNAFQRGMIGEAGPWGATLVRFLFGLPFSLALLGIATADMRDPTPREEPPDTVDPSKNMGAAAALRKAGRTVADVEARLGRGVKEWTRADRDRIRAMLAPKREPGEEG
jgi:hypothetical protein